MKDPRVVAQVCFAMTGAVALFTAHVSPAAESLSDQGQSPSAQSQAASVKTEQDLVKLLDAPLLFVKRHSYTGIHIYDTYYKWPPGGGGIYVLENPQAPRDQWRIRAVIDPSTPETLGEGVYTHPELSWDAAKLLFCFKGKPDGSTRIYEIGVNGTGLRRVADPTPTCAIYKGAQSGQHDIAPAYLPDGRIVFLSTRPSGLVPCANEGVSILHVMNADGSNLHPISVNNVNEFDPAVLPDGRILFGRWEYVDKNALTIQSLWTMHPDGTEETALYANNMVFPEAILDARPVPDSHLIVGTFAKHNAPPRGSIAFVDPRIGKNDPRAIFNLEHPKDPTKDTGDSCEPWPLSRDAVVFSGRSAGHMRNAIEIMDRSGSRFVLLSDTNICLHSPMLVKSRPRPPVLPNTVNPSAQTGRFFVQDIYRGLEGVARGEVKWLRVIEETSRVSATPGGANPYNQTFLVSAALAFSAKNFLGIVPVDERGSAYFEVPSGRALYLQALDAERRLIQSMRTFVQAAPGTTRSCIGCHEHKQATTSNERVASETTQEKPCQLQPESWGSGCMDFPSMVQPILDRHCASCHGGEKGIAAGMDLTGGWTEHFDIAYENLVTRRESQLVADWIAGIDCMNGTAHWSSQIFPPRRHGSGAAPLAKLLLSGHSGYATNLNRQERDLIFAWIDSNGLYHGNWDYTDAGCAIKEWPAAKQRLVAVMENAGCAKCHGETNKITFFENDWFNLKEPQLSRILRAPLPKGADGLGLGLCQDRKVDSKRQRIRLLVDGYAHAVKPVKEFSRRELGPLTNAPSVATFASTSDLNYQKMLGIIRRSRGVALATPRVDMPGAETVAGASRQFQAPPLPKETLPLQAEVDADGVVHLAWERTARTIGLEFELHRNATPNFVPNEKTLVATTSLFKRSDPSSPVGTQHYALVMISGSQRSQPVHASVAVPQASQPPVPVGLQATPASCSICLDWQTFEGRRVSYNVYRRKRTTPDYQKLNEKPIRVAFFADSGLDSEEPSTYVVRAVSPRGLESEPSVAVTAAARVIKEPVFAAAAEAEVRGVVYDGEKLSSQKHGKARSAEGVLEFKEGGHFTFPHRSEFELGQPLSVECWVWLDKAGKSPVLVSCGRWREAGWFLQRLGERWRWHVGGVDCDGGKPETNRWIHLVGAYNGKTLRLFEDGVQVAEATGGVKTDAFPGELHIGQYSGGPSEDFQVTGRMAGVKVYHRPLSTTEVADASKTKPGKTNPAANIRHPAS